MTDQLVTTRIDEETRVGYATLDRGPVNAWTYDLLDQLGDAIEELRVAEAVNVMVVESAHDVFSAGGDLEWYADKSNREMRNFVIKVHETLQKIENTPKLAIAAMNGAAVGGGLELALACDLRYLAADAEVGQIETTIGALPGGGGTQRLPRIVGKAKALELIMNAERLDAEEAARIGLVTEVFDPEYFDAEVQVRAEEFGDGPAYAYGLAKQAVEKGLEMDLNDGLWFEFVMTEAIHETRDYHEGTTAFREGREPEFEGR